MKIRKVLIAHQSTIPHYRVPFYEAVRRLKPSWWDFNVVFDNDPTRRERIFVEPVDPDTFGFTTIPTRTIFFGVFKRQIMFQTFVWRAGRYDLIVLEDAFYNLSYPAARLWRLLGKPIAYWGHGKDRTVEAVSGWKRISEGVKRYWATKSEGYFAYTPGVRSELTELGVESSKIHNLNNTIDIVAERLAFETTIEHRQRLRQEVGLANRKVLLLVGRLNEGKRIEFLGDAIRELRITNPEYHLVVIGGGQMILAESLQKKLGKDGFTYCPATTDRRRLAEWYVRSDVYVHPGEVGLGVVQSLCYDLTPVVIHRETHNPEYEYLGDHNSVIVRSHASPAEYASQIDKHCSDLERWESHRALAWPSIRHLTIEAMARHFVDGVSQILRSARAREGEDAR
jgi:glycosyltransferase involved in cell wall biosynthesis